MTNRFYTHPTGSLTTRRHLESRNAVLLRVSTHRGPLEQPMSEETKCKEQDKW